MFKAGLKLDEKFIRPSKNSIVMSFLPQIIGDDTLDSYWDPTFSEMEMELDFGRDKILEIIMVIHHYFRERLKSMSLGDSKAVHSERYKNLYFLNTFLYNITILALQAKFSFLTTAPRQLPRRSSLASVIERHSVVLMYRSNAIIHNPLLTGKLAEESVRHLFTRHFASIFEGNDKNCDSMTNSITAVITAIHENLTLMGKGEHAKKIIAAFQDTTSGTCPHTYEPGNKTEKAGKVVNSSFYNDEDNEGSSSSHNVMSEGQMMQMGIQDNDEDDSENSMSESGEESIRLKIKNWLQETESHKISDNPAVVKGEEVNAYKNPVLSSNNGSEQEQSGKHSSPVAFIPLQNDLRDAIEIEFIDERYKKLCEKARWLKTQYAVTKAHLQLVEKQLRKPKNDSSSDDLDDERFFHDILTYDTERAAACSQNSNQKKLSRASTSFWQKQSCHTIQRNNTPVETDFSVGERINDMTTRWCLICKSIHEISKCPLLLGKVCYNCGDLNHIAQICTAPKKD